MAIKVLAKFGRAHNILIENKVYVGMGAAVAMTNDIGKGHLLIKRELPSRLRQKNI